MRFTRHSSTALALTLLLSLALHSQPAEAQPDGYSASLAAAIADWNANLVSGAEVQTRIAHQFDDIATAHRTGWEAATWAAHAYTQLPGDDPAARLLLMDRAQGLLDQARARFADAPDNVLSDFHMLQALIHSNRSATVEDDEERAQLRALARREQATAEDLDGDNPRAWMFRGFALIRADRTDEGRIVLTKALGKFDAYPSDNPLYPDWGRRWIGFWMGGIEKRDKQELPARDPQGGNTTSSLQAPASNSTLPLVSPL